MATKIDISNASQVVKNLRKELVRTNSTIVNMAAEYLQDRVQDDLDERFHVKTPFTEKSIKLYRAGLNNAKPNAIVRTRADYLAQTETGETQKPVKGKDVPIASGPATGGPEGLSERLKRVAPKYKLNKLGEIYDNLNPAHPSKSRAGKQKLMMQARMAFARGESKASVIWESSKGRGLYALTKLKQKTTTARRAKDETTVVTRLSKKKGGKNGKWLPRIKRKKKMHRVRIRSRKVLSFDLSMLYDLTHSAVPRKKNPFMGDNTKIMLQKDMPKITRERIERSVQVAIRLAAMKAKK